jgi:hypothetical protein
MPTGRAAAAGAAGARRGRSGRHGSATLLPGVLRSTEHRLASLGIQSAPPTAERWRQPPGDWRAVPDNISLPQPRRAASGAKTLISATAVQIPASPPTLHSIHEPSAMAVRSFELDVCMSRWSLPPPCSRPDRPIRMERSCTTDPSGRIGPGSLARVRRRVELDDPVVAGEHDDSSPSTPGVSPPVAGSPTAGPLPAMVACPAGAMRSADVRASPTIDRRTG